MLFAKVKLFQFSKQLLELFKNYPKATEAQDEQTHGPDKFSGYHREAGW